MGPVTEVCHRHPCLSGRTNEIIPEGLELELEAIASHGTTTPMRETGMTVLLEITADIVPVKAVVVDMARAVCNVGNTVSRNTFCY